MNCRWSPFTWAILNWLSTNDHCTQCKRLGSRDVCCVLLYCIWSMWYENYECFVHASACAYASITNVRVSIAYGCAAVLAYALHWFMEITAESYNSILPQHKLCILICAYVHIAYTVSHAHYGTVTVETRTKDSNVAHSNVYERWAIENHIGWLLAQRHNAQPLASKTFGRQTFMVSYTV